MSEGESPFNYCVLTPNFRGGKLFVCFLSSFCCVYLAFKIDEYVVSIDQFGNTITPDLRQEVVEYVLSHEVVHKYIFYGGSLHCLCTYTVCIRFMCSYCC